MRFPARSFFRRTTEEFVVIRPVRVHGKMLEPGTVFKAADVKLHVLRMWYQQRRIGDVNDRWTEYQQWLLELRKARAAGKALPQPPDWYDMPTPIVRLTDLHQLIQLQADKKVAVKVAEAEEPEVNEALEQLTELQSDKRPLTEMPYAVHKGGGAYEVYADGEVTVVKGKKAVQAMGVEDIR